MEGLINVKRTLFAVTLLAVLAGALYVFWRLRRGPDAHDFGLPAEEARNWPGVGKPILRYATPEERARYDHDS